MDGTISHQALPTLTCIYTSYHLKPGKRGAGNRQVPTKVRLDGPGGREGAAGLGQLPAGDRETEEKSLFAFEVTV